VVLLKELSVQSLSARLLLPLRMLLLFLMMKLLSMKKIHLIKMMPFTLLMV
jgi:hypothetical protein